MMEQNNKRGRHGRATSTKPSAKPKQQQGREAHEVCPKQEPSPTWSPGVKARILTLGSWYDCEVVKVAGKMCLVRYADNGEEEDDVDVGRLRERHWVRLDAKVQVICYDKFRECKVLRISRDLKHLTVRYDENGYAEEDVDVNRVRQLLPCDERRSQKASKPDRAAPRPATIFSAFEPYKRKGWDQPASATHEHSSRHASSSSHKGLRPKRNETPQRVVASKTKSEPRGKSKQTSITIHYVFGGRVSSNIMYLDDKWLARPCSALKIAFARRWNETGRCCCSAKIDATRLAMSTLAGFGVNDNSIVRDILHVDSQVVLQDTGTSS